MRTRVKMVLSLAAAALATAVFASVGVESIERFHRVDARVAIGGQPTPEQVRPSRTRGSPRILNLREESEENDALHARAARESGLQLYRVPVSKTNPTDASVAKFLKVTDDETLYPIYHLLCGGQSCRRLLDDPPRPARRLEARGGGEGSGGRGTGQRADAGFRARLHRASFRSRGTH